MREVGLGHTALDDQQDDWRRVVRLGSRLGLGGAVARGPGERGQGRRGGMCGRRKELGCGLGCGSMACLMAALVRVSSGGDLAAARGRARSRGNKSKAAVI